ncbi:hypothetical protein JCM15519_15030 [Fundidesulfovibrio butyratiphilus]
MDLYPTSPETGMPKEPVANIINDLVVQNGVAAAKVRNKDLDAFISASSSSSTIVVETLKGQLANRTT